jgi:ribosomal-protein-alanine N-acetyltransferase
VEFKVFDFSVDSGDSTNTITAEYSMLSKQLADIEDGAPRAWRADQFESTISILSSGYLVLGYNNADRPACFLLSQSVFPENEILRLAVHPSNQRQGIGEQLVRFFLNFVIEQGIKLVMLEVACDNRAAVSLYIKTGFVEKSIRPGYYQSLLGGDRVDGLMMQKAI